MRHLKRFLPSLDTLQRNRWLRWLGPHLQHPRLWHFSRRGLALGMALGLFFGLLIPVAQIPFSAAAAVVLRANVPAAVAATLVTNPLTFGPVYYGAWRLGSVLLGEGVTTPRPPPAVPGAAAPAGTGWWQQLTQGLAGVGKPLLLGLAVLATGVGVLTYFGISWAWAARVWWSRRRRRRAATAAGPRL
jgi:uncharacterized protein